MRNTTQCVQSIVTYFNVGRTRAVIATVFSLIAVAVVIGSFLILGGESIQPRANIRTAEDALHWAVATLFGAEPSCCSDDRSATLEGRLISLCPVMLSLGLIGSLAGVLSAWIEQERGGPSRPRQPESKSR